MTTLTPSDFRSDRKALRGPRMRRATPEGDLDPIDEERVSTSSPEVPYRRGRALTRSPSSESSSNPSPHTPSATFDRFSPIGPKLKTLPPKEGDGEVFVDAGAFQERPSLVQECLLSSPDTSGPHKSTLLRFEDPGDAAPAPRKLLRFRSRPRSAAEAPPSTGPRNGAKSPLAMPVSPMLHSEPVASKDMTAPTKPRRDIFGLFKPSADNAKKKAARITPPLADLIGASHGFGRRRSFDGTPYNSILSRPQSVPPPEPAETRQGRVSFDVHMPRPERAEKGTPKLTDMSTDSEQQRGSPETAKGGSSPPQVQQEITPAVTVALDEPTRVALTSSDDELRVPSRDSTYFTPLEYAQSSFFDFDQESTRSVGHREDGEPDSTPRNSGHPFAPNRQPSVEEAATATDGPPSQGQGSSSPERTDERAEHVRSQATSPKEQPIVSTRRTSAVPSSSPSANHQPAMSAEESVAQDAKKSRRRSLSAPKIRRRPKTAPGVAAMSDYRRNADDLARRLEAYV